MKTCAITAILGLTSALRIMHPADELLNCECLGAADVTFNDPVYNNQCDIFDLPMDYGVTECMAFDMSIAEVGCDGSASAPEWCSAAWCYVNDECEAADKIESAYAPGTFFSYNACMDSATFPADPDAKTQSECAAMMAEEDAAAAAAAEAAAAAAAAAAGEAAEAMEMAVSGEMSAEDAAAAAAAARAAAEAAAAEAEAALA